MGGEKRLGDLQGDRAAVFDARGRASRRREGRRAAAGHARFAR